MTKEKILVVGAGFSGAVIARELAEADYSVIIIEKRGHVAGNAFDYKNKYGIRIHKYGPHLFHTSNLKVVNWLSKFTEWIEYKHKVKAMLSNGSLVTLPVNLETISLVGKENIIDTFYRPYTRKMWGVDIEEIDPEILNRVSVREDDNQFYFPDDVFQALPINGYSSLFESILNHPNIHLKLNTSYSRGMENDFLHTFNSMPIDEFFDFKVGNLQYRSIKFHTFEIPVPKAFPVVTVNFTHSDPYTRVTEWKNLPGNPIDIPYTTLTIEEPCSYSENNFERYYPVKDVAGINRALYLEYKNMTPENITFIGRCGKYIYINMDQAVSAALSIAGKFKKEN